MSTTLAPRCTAALLALCVSACATPGLIDSASEQSVRATLAAQIANPQAVRNTNPVSGIDGPSALQIQQKYEKSFGKPVTDSDAPLVQRR